MIVAVGLSHKSAPVEVRERLAIPASELRDVLDNLRACPELSEAMVLSTCNRVEVFAAAKLAHDLDGSLATEAVTRMLCERAGPELCARVRDHLFQFADDAAVRHLFRVAASLDSLVVGEPQILGQVKDAFDSACRAGAIGPLLGRAAASALHVAKRVRSETRIGAGTVSISSAAVDLARQIFGNLDGRVVALLGAGDMAEAAAKVLCDEGARLRVVNRSVERAQIVASAFRGKARPWTELQRTLVEADVVISSTAAPHVVLTRALVSGILKARRGRSLFLIDIAVPRDVEPQVNDLENVFLYDIDDLERIAAETMRGRLVEAQNAERIVDEEAHAFGAWQGGLQVTPAIVALRSHLQTVLSAEVDRSLSGKLRQFGPDERKALEAMVTAAVNKLAHTPSTRLKEAAAEGNAAALLESLQTLFDLSWEEPSRDAIPCSQPPCALAADDAPEPPSVRCPRDRSAGAPDAPKEAP